MNHRFLLFLPPLPTITVLRVPMPALHVSGCVPPGNSRLPATATLRAYAAFPAHAWSGPDAGFAARTSCYTRTYTRSRSCVPLLRHRTTFSPAGGGGSLRPTWKSGFAPTALLVYLCHYALAAVALPHFSRLQGRRVRCCLLPVILPGELPH